MPWIQLKLNTTGANAEELSDALMEAGSVSITFQDTHDTPVFEPLPGETRLWGDTDVIGLFDAETDMKEVVAILENHPLLGAGFAHKIEQLEDKDWEREWMDNFHPMQFSARLEMVRAGVAHLPNVVVHEGSQYIISRATFPAYFLKETGKVQQAWSEIDVLIFRDFIAPALGITHRFIGSEPFCDITRQYNQTLHDLLASHIEVVEMPRIKATGNAISASEVRRLLKTQQFSRIREIVPDSTFTHLETHYRASAEVA